MELIERTQIDKYNQLKKLLDNFKKSPKDRITKAYLETRLDIANSYWEEFQKSHDTLVTLPPSEGMSLNYFAENIYDKTLDLYLDLKTRIKEQQNMLVTQMTSFQHESSDVNVSQQPVVVAKLPPIQLPRFSGDYREWLSFRDLFISLVHSNHLISNVNKCQYLKSSLFGEAEQLVKQIQVSETNYDLMWATINKRYDNNRSIVNAYIGKLLQQKKLINESSKGIKDLLDCTSECLISLKNLNIPTDKWDDIIVFIVIQKLDSDSHKLFEQKIEGLTRLPNWKDLSDFLEHRFRTLEAIKTKDLTQSKPVAHTKSFVTNVSTTPTSQCSYCRGDHYIFRCKDFFQLTVNARQEFVQKNNLCFNCLKKGHSVKMCLQSTTCRKCGRKHHSLLHGYSVTASTRNSSPNIQEPAQTQTTETIHTMKTSISDCPVILATALVSVHSQRDNIIHTLRALIDPGSQASIVTEAVCQSLGLTRTPIRGTIEGVNANRTTCKSIVEFEIMSTHNSNHKVKIAAYVLKSLTSYLPQHKHSIDWPQLKSLDLADTSFHLPGKIDLILGADIYPDILEPGVITYKNNNNTLVAQKTTLGWLISGKNSNYNGQYNQVHTHHLKIDIDSQLRRFWELEEPVYGKRTMTNDELTCENYFETTHERQKDGHYQVRLPFTTHPPNIGESLTLALKGLNNLEKRFKKQEGLGERYRNFMQDYLDQKHMELVPHNDKTEHVYYLPHHAIINEQHTTTKLRVVFNGSAETKNKKSLNNNLLIGPPLQNDIRDVTVRWRLHAVVLVGDIKQMYRQIWIHPEDRDFQRIVWRFSCTEPVQHYKLTTVTYGTSSAPYLAIKVLKQLAMDEKDNFPPEVIDSLLNDYYIDDWLAGGATAEFLMELKQNMINLLHRGGFSLHKWTSNHDKIESTTHSTRQILGITWNSITDKFELKIELKCCNTITKRSVLGEIAQIYDPAGWLSPVVVLAKHMLQTLWTIKLDWDDALPDSLAKEWTTFRQDLQNMPIIEIDRWLGFTPDVTLIELHGFSDSSDIAYSAVIYSRIITPNSIKVTMIEGKTRVAPVKKISTPRLELCGAVLLAKLMHRIQTALNIPSSNVYAWTDATIVLAWLQKAPSYWNTFVANRVTEVTNIIDKDRWNHVPSQENPADVASRGISPAELPSHHLWWNGPAWLHSTDVLPVQKLPLVQTELEMKVPLKAIVCNSVVSDTSEDDIFMRFSNLTRLTRVVAYCLRFQSFCKHVSKNLNSSTHKISNYLTTIELKNSLNILLKLSQKNFFAHEISILQNNKNLTKGNKLRSLNPFISKDGLLKVGGRLHNSLVSDSIKHPIILDGKCRLAYLIVLYTHHQTLHGGFKLMLNTLRNKYYIFKIRNLIKTVIHSCTTCCRFAAKVTNQLMGDFPKERVTPQRPFIVCSLDFAGPVILKLFSGRGSNKTQKAYIAVFICTAVKAVHLELVTSLTSEGFLAAFRRFTSRRGRCVKLISDCGTNFIGASKELKIMFNECMSNVSSEIAELLANDGTDWQFNPAGAPHMNGLAEAAVRSTKFHINRVLNDTKLTYEEYCTLLCQIECCLNSRPLTALQDDSHGTCTALTPGHFLIGEIPSIVPEPNLENSKVTYNERWVYLQQKLQSFWRQWSQEYLVNLQKRFKWTRAQPNVEINSIVLIKDERLPPGKWLLGRVVTTFPGKDGLVRVVSVRYGNTTVKRPIHKLCILPVDPQ